MEPRSLEFVRAACGGELRAGAPDALVKRLCTDSRQARAGDLFVAIQGDRFDGHEFLPQVSRAGATAVLIEQAKMPAKDLGCAVIAVEDTRRALGRLAARYRADFDLPIIAVGGSNGKTTTKELVAAVLREKLRTLWSEASFNNDIGVPVTLLKLAQAHEVAVLEAGTNHPGELAPLLQMIQPRYGVLTGIGREHLEFFGDLAGVAREEGALAESLPAAGKLFLNGDDEWAVNIGKRSQAPVARVGFGKGNDWRAESVAVAEAGMSFQVHSPRREFAGTYRINLLGRHQVLNALLAVAVGAELGLKPDEVRRGLASCQPPKMRLQLWEAQGVRVLDDAYNANADSMLAALQTLRDLPCAGRRVAVLGDMAELGEHSAAAHQEIGRRAAELGVAHLVVVGRWASQTGAAARAAGLQAVTELAEVAAAAAAVKDLVEPGDLVLLKASRATGLERIAEVLRRDRKK